MRYTRFLDIFRCTPLSQDVKQNTLSDNLTRIKDFYYRSPKAAAVTGLYFGCIFTSDILNE